MAVRMNDDYVVLLEESLRESKQQREENKRVLEELQEERRRNKELMDSLSKIRQDAALKTPSPSGKRKRRESIEVSTPCKRKTRDIYKELLKKDDFDGFIFDENFTSAANSAVVKRVIRAVIEDSGENIFPRLHIEEGLKTYFRSLKDNSKRELKGTSLLHKTKCRRQIRKREKCCNLKKALAVSNWEEDSQVEANLILRPDLMSSEESGTEVGDDGADVAFMTVKKLPWERKKMRTIKKKLRKIYLDSLSQRQRQGILERRRDGGDSTRPVPADVPDWAVRHEDED